MPIHVHIINHTHWDREWFLTSEYTSRWIPDLIRNLEKKTTNNPTFRYWLDGQTLVVEDLLQIAPEMESRIRQLIESNRLTIGPYYSQPDWQLTAGELLIRNLYYGIKDAARFGGDVRTGWLVDTFGHTSQTPQIHNLFDIDALYVWRGVPQLVPYFSWKGADGTLILTVNLFGGYRNLFGVTHVPEVANRRLIGEVERLVPYYPTPDIPLFDGYDLEDNPEDPLLFYENTKGLPPNLELHEDTPVTFSRFISGQLDSIPQLDGELNSGKIGATFPGTFSARTYLKIMASDCYDLLYKYGEPLASLAFLCGQPYPDQHFERINRALLQNAVHDCICGVSIDQVHEKMDLSYHRVFDELTELLQASLAHLLQDFESGEYVVSTSPFAGEQWLVDEGSLIHVQTNGIGVWPVTEKVSIDKLPIPREVTTDFVWKNEYYEIRVQPNGLLSLGEAVLGELLVYRELGDTYSDERGELMGNLLPIAPSRVMEESQQHTVLEFEYAWSGNDAQVSAQVRLTLDPSPLLRWQIDLDSKGTDLTVEIRFATSRTGQVWAGMPFDVLERAEVDSDLLPQKPSPDLARILLGQREINEVRTFPFQDFVTVSDLQGSSVVFAQGLRSYRADAGTLSLTLRRSVEWLTRSDLKYRVGDAGPFFYVPDARCERKVRHHLAFAALPYAADSMELQAINASFQNPPLVVRTKGNGQRKQWEFLQENLPLSSLQIHNGSLSARFYNPTRDSVKLSQAYLETDVWGQARDKTDAVASKKIVTLHVERDEPHQMGTSPSFLVLNLPQWRVGENRSVPDPAVLAQLEEKISLLAEQLEEVQARLTQIQVAGEADQDARLRLEHRQYVLQRERLEYKLSFLLNKRKLQFEGNTPPAVLYQADAEIATVGKELNQLRIKRRIYDYVVQALD